MGGGGGAWGEVLKGCVGERAWGGGGVPDEEVFKAQSGSTEPQK